MPGNQMGTKTEKRQNSGNAIQFKKKVLKG